MEPLEVAGGCFFVACGCGCFRRDEGHCRRRGDERARGGEAQI